MVCLVRSEDRRPSKRVFPLLQNLDLDTVTFAQVQSTGDPISIEDMNEQEMIDLIIVNLARLTCAGEWDGLLTAGSSGATTLSGLTDVLINATNWVNGFLIQTNSGGSAPTTGTLSTASNNIGIGADVLKSITTADRCIVLGEEAGRGITTGSDNVVIGSRAMHNDAAGTQKMNIAIGHQSMAQIQDGADENVGIGYQSFGPSNQLAGDGNTAVGFFSGSTVTSGQKNLMLGAGSGNISTGDFNVIIGDANAASATADSQLVISSGNGGVSWIVGTDAGTCYQGDNAATWSTTSDRALKREIADATKGLDAINAIQVRTFRFRKDNPYGMDSEPSRV